MCVCTSSTDSDSRPESARALIAPRGQSGRRLGWRPPSAAAFIGGDRPTGAPGKERQKSRNHRGQMRRLARRLSAGAAGRHWPGQRAILGPRSRSRADGPLRPGGACAQHPRPGRRLKIPFSLSARPRQRRPGGKGGRSCPPAPRPPGAGGLWTGDRPPLPGPRSFPSPSPRKSYRYIHTVPSACLLCPALLCSALLCSRWLDCDCKRERECIPT